MAVTEKPFIVSVSPHVKSEETTSRIMWSVSASLAPAVVMGAYFFGPRALFTIALCIARFCSLGIFFPESNREKTYRQ